MTPEERLHNNLRDLWALVTERPGISLREIAKELNVNLGRSRRLVNILLASGNLTKGRHYSGRTLRATVPMITMKRKKSNDEEIPTV
ncbi:hypothetical protein LCGC14_2093110 [marine sediment metagenome]|uniref:HTH iclR-type domain-containing protein n=1 Tax=marine sediment metagenome TaxID=412755 RepID=A0A0F9GQ71_9ZZZZ